MRIALDAMGGDYAPEATVEGGILAAEEFGCHIILVGESNVLERELSKYKPSKWISIEQASEVIEMTESPAASIRKKRNSSICVAANLVAGFQADALVTAGNTGAAVCAASLKLGMLSGIERPGIAIVIPTLKGPCLLIDVGANIMPKPIHLLDYAIMAEAYCRLILNRKSPAVGLLNIGEEETKGTDFIRETHGLLQKSQLNFVGNIEARDIFSGKVDCIICDGFVGNVALKVSEGLIEAAGEFIKRLLSKDVFFKAGAIMMKRSMRKLRRTIDYAEYGGAQLLGINGVCVIAHGRSKAKAIKNAIRVACDTVNLSVNEKIIKRLEALNLG
jgi:glycerol-3-phosphate acyltransferase PlsX